MAEIDALSLVPLGHSNTGSAVVLDKANNTGDEMFRVLIAKQQQERAKTQKNEAVINDLLDESKLKPKWAMDTVKYVQPKIKEFENEVISEYKKQGHNIDPITLKRLEIKRNQLANEVQGLNSMYDAEQARIKELRGENADKFDPISWEKRRIWNDPYSDPKTAAEIEKEGYFNWRAKNYSVYENEPAYNMLDHAKDLLKGQEIEHDVLDANGKPALEYDPRTKSWLQAKTKEIPVEKIIQRVQSAWDNPHDFKSTRLRERSIEWADKNFKVNSNGAVTVLNGSPETIAVMENINPKSLQGGTPEQIKSAIGKQYAIEQFKLAAPAPATTHGWIKTAKDSESSNEGDGGVGPEVFNWASGLQNADPNGLHAPRITKELAKKIIGSDDEESINKAQEIANKHFANKMSQYQNTPYVSFTFKDGKDNPKLTYQGKQFISNGFTRKKDGKWYMIGTQEMSSADNLSAIADIIAAAKGNEFGGAKKDRTAKKDLAVQEILINPDIALKHGFKGPHAIENFKKFLNSQVPEDY